MPTRTDGGVSIPATRPVRGRPFVHRVRANFLRDLPALLLSLPLGLVAFWTLLASFTPTAQINRGEWFDTLTLENYRLALISAPFGLLYRNTLIYTLGLLFVQVPSVTLAAYALSRYRFKGRNLVFYLILFQLFIPPVILIVPNFAILRILGLDDTLVGVAMPYIASATGVFLVRQGFMQIPRQFDEAAQIDGANSFQTFWHVLVPQVRSYISAFAVVSLVYHWNEFLWPLVAISSRENRLLSVGLASFARSAESGAEWGLIAAGGVLVAGPLVLAFVLFQRFFIESFAHTGIKG
jgi:sn-glycerol 3-phosphate transport system permease protein